MGRDCNWTNHSDIDRWVRDWEPDRQGVSDAIIDLRMKLQRGDFTGRNEASVRAYLDANDEMSFKTTEWAKADREERALGAADRSATAAEKSVRVATIALVISVVALLVASWPHIFRE